MDEIGVLALSIAAVEETIQSVEEQRGVGVEGRVLGLNEDPGERIGKLVASPEGDYSRSPWTK